MTRRLARPCLAAAAGLGLVAALACDVRPPPVSGAPDAIDLVALEPALLEVPTSSLPEAFGDEIAMRLGGWEHVASDGVADEWIAKLARAVPDEARLEAPDGRFAERHRADRQPRDPRGDPAVGLWRLGDRRVELAAPADAPTPADGSHRLRFTSVSLREASWNRDRSRGADGELPEPGRFARRQVTIGRSTRRGLLLPAPAHVAWDLRVPPSGELQLRPGLLAPDWPGGLTSDGYELVIEVEPVDGAIVRRSWRIRSDAFELLRVDLARHAGQRVRLHLRTRPGGGAVRDYAFLAEPVVAARSADSRRVVILSVDALRPDRPRADSGGEAVSPTLDRLAATGAAFERARSVAPWRLPSVRSLLTGRQPEAWEGAPTLAGLLGARGFATALLAADPVLAAPSGTQRGWDWHHVQPSASAAQQTERALDWLAEVDGRDALLLVQYADADLRQVDHEVGRLLEALGDRDLVVVVAGRGEASPAHEEGLPDVALRMPLAFRGPGVVAARHAAPVSLLDVVPTLLEALGREAPRSDGVSLWPRLRGDHPRAPDRRAIGFGHPREGGEAWGVVVGEDKYVVHRGVERRTRVPSRMHGEGVESEVYHRAVAPEVPEPLRDALVVALGRALRPVWRVVALEAPQWPREDVVVELSVAGGIERAWWARDPEARSSVDLAVGPGGSRLVATWRRGYRGARELFVLPREPIDPAQPPRAVLRVGGVERPLSPPDRPQAGVLLRAEPSPGRELLVTLALSLPPAGDARTP